MIGTIVDKRYRIEAMLGEGGMGVVYKAYDTGLARRVALKLMHEQLARRDSFRHRFSQEAQAAARLDHQSIVPIYDFKSTPELIYIVMAYVPGLNLRSALRKMRDQGGWIDLREALLVMAQVADALDYAHRQGVIHRDIKPDNVLLRPLEEPTRPNEPAIRAIVTDFGLAKLLESDVQTQTNTFMGTLPYMSPEHVLGRPTDGRTDLFSVGVMLYELITGQLPYPVKTPTEAVLRHTKESHVPAPDPAVLRPDLPASVAGLLRKAIAHNREERYQTGGSMADALRIVADEMAGLVVPDTVLSAEPSISLVHTVFSAADELSDTDEQSGMPPSPPSTPPPPPPKAVPVSEQPTILPATPPIIRPPTQPADQLIIYCGDKHAQTVKLSKSPMRLGRGSENDIILLGKGISRKHLQLNRSGNGWTLIDLGSANGTFLKEQRVSQNKPIVWARSEPLRVGPCTLYWQPENMPLPARPASLMPASSATKRRSTLPIWGIVAIATLLLALCIAAFALNSFFGERNSDATATAQMLTATLEAGNEQTRQAIAQATSDAFGTATAEAWATATAEQALLLGDDDEDGLTQAEEAEIGTDPNNPDSDGDGLKDGEEVNLYNSNPLEQDTDGDGRDDGEEVDAGSDPAVAETVTPTPSNTPSPTTPPSRTPTATPPATTTPSQTPTATSTPTPPATATSTNTPPNTPTSTATPTNTPPPTDTVTPTIPPIVLQNWQPTFQLINGSTTYLFRLFQTGDILAVMEWEGGDELSMALFDSSGGSPVEEVSGESPLQLSHTVNGNGQTRGSTWLIRITNSNGTAVNGTFKMESPTVSWSDGVTIDPNVGQGVALLSLTDSGEISAEAVWTGIAPPQMRLGISSDNGTVVDSDTGAPPLNVSHLVENSQRSWQIRLISEGNTSAQTSFNIFYP